MDGSFDEVSRFFGQGGGLSQEVAQTAKAKEFLNIKNKRRSKKDKTGRNFICGCGKEYLSYPALYTHIKTKHGGEQPQGTKNHVASNSKRGRPKKVDPHAISESRPLLEVNIFEPVSQIKPDIPILNDFVEKLDLRLLTEYKLEGETDPTAGFPSINFYDNDKPSYHPFHVIINNLKSDNRSDAILSNHCCDTVMALFLFSASKICAEKFYLILGIFFRNLRECLNEHGYDIITEYFIRNYSEEARSLLPKRREDRTFCENESPEYLPLVADKFILYYLPKYCPEFDQQLAVDLMFDFCKWLSKRKFTKIKVSFNDDDDSNDMKDYLESPTENNYEYGKLFGALK